MDKVGTRAVPSVEEFQRILGMGDLAVTLNTLLSDCAKMLETAGSDVISPESIVLEDAVATGITLSGAMTTGIKSTGATVTPFNISGYSGVLINAAPGITGGGLKIHTHANVNNSGGETYDLTYMNELKGEFVSTSGTMVGLGADFTLSASGTGAMCASSGYAKLLAGVTLSGATWPAVGVLTGGQFFADVFGVLDGTAVLVTGLYGGIGLCTDATLTTAAYVSAIWGDYKSAVTLETGKSSVLLLTHNGASVVDYGILIEANSTGTFGQVFVAGTSGTPLVCDTASAKFLQFYLDCGATSGTSVGLYIREYLTGAGGSNAVARIYSDVVGVAASTAQGMQCSLGFGESTTTGSVTGLGVAGRFQIGLANIAYPGTGTLAVIQSEIYSFGASSDPSGNAIAMFGVVNDGNSDGMADVDDDAVLFHFRGWTSATGNMVVKAASPGAMGNATYSVRCKMPDGTLAYLNFTAAAVTA